MLWPVDRETSAEMMPEISRSRDNAGRIMSARRHKIHKVFVNDKQGHDLLVLGHAKLDLVNGKTVEAGFATHIVINAQSTAAGSPRLDLLQVFAVSHTLFTVLRTKNDSRKG